MIQRHRMTKSGLSLIARANVIDDEDDSKAIIKRGCDRNRERGSHASSRVEEKQGAGEKKNIIMTRHDERDPWKV